MWWFKLEICTIVAADYTRGNVAILLRIFSLNEQVFYDTKYKSTSNFNYSVARYQPCLENEFQRCVLSMMFVINWLTLLKVNICAIGRYNAGCLLMLIAVRLKNHHTKYAMPSNCNWGK